VKFSTLCERSGVEHTEAKHLKADASGGSDVRSETFVLVKLDELDASRGFRARGTTGVADTERMKATFNR
jgi:hypothetical protein